MCIYNVKDKKNNCKELFKARFKLFNYIILK